MTTRQRPLSPHLQVYRPVYTMVLSILHRVTGLALSVGLLLLAAWLLALSVGPRAYALITGVLDSRPGFVVLAGLAAAFCYHLCAGIRHLISDTGHGFERAAARRSAAALVVAALLLALAALFAMLRIGGTA
jgi:succinate dehydrogenase / fumarate reductase cytochrome b subunit